MSRISSLVRGSLRFGMRARGPCSRRKPLTLVGAECAMRTLPCQGRGACSGGPRGPPGGVLRVVI
eukprot:scaffold76802_cov64-Phaeocystis_antarctica.AAC.1